MFATLIAVIVALVLGHAMPALVRAIRGHDWYAQWIGWLDARFPGEDSLWHGGAGIAIALAPPLLAVGLMQWALDAPLAGVAGLLFGIAVLVYAWGPRDLDLDVDDILDAPHQSARRAAAARLWPDADHPETQVPLAGAALVEAVFVNAQRRWFGVLFWFLLLGAWGALLYRLVALAAAGDASRALPARTRDGARLLLAVLDWPVAQLMTLAMALVGDFDAVVGAWKDTGGASLRLDTGFLGAAARASVRSELADDAADAIADGTDDAPAPELPELRDAMSLAWRVLLAWLAVIALFVIGGWVS